MIKIRKGKKEDVPAMLELIKELASYENALEKVETTEEQMLKDGFGPEPIFHALVAESHQVIVGIVIYYFRYSTWKGKRLYLEDIVVTESQRGQGVGKLLFDATIEASKEHNCTGMMWQVLNWNQSAIAFYNKYGAELDHEWINCHLSNS
ncbi:MAG: GNAT family N-acetyltransferase [Cyclobacteriaceae bacterium]|nr:GNAT family N-acetyltransferase [Cyclobacteriaceae bacterium]